MRVALAGYRGFIGSSYMRYQEEVEFIPISRALLYGETSQLSQALSDCEVVLNLAGSPIARRWTRKRKREIENSRRGVNQNLVKAVNQMEKKPELLISASAIGIYGQEGVQTEVDFETEDHYMARVVKNWEAPLENLDPHIKCAILRIGVVLGREGGALGPLLSTSRFGFLAIMGSGRQIFSFIHLKDLHRALDFILFRKLSGMFNLTGPFPVDNATFTKKLAEHTGTRYTVRIPSIFLQIGMGEAHILLTGGPHVLPERLTGEGFKFDFPTAGDALRNLLDSIEESH